MRRLWIAIAVLMITGVGHAGKAEASYYSADDLLEYCESDQVALRNVCAAYLGGLVDVTKTYGAWDMTNPDFCIPNGASLGQLARVVAKGLNAEPEKLHHGAASRIANIFYKAFPCD